MDAEKFSSFYGGDKRFKNKGRIGHEIPAILSGELTTSVKLVNTRLLHIDFADGWIYGKLFHKLENRRRCHLEISKCR
jgi:hypothetical protein